MMREPHSVRLRFWNAHCLRKEFRVYYGYVFCRRGMYKRHSIEIGYPIKAPVMELGHMDGLGG